MDKIVLCRVLKGQECFMSRSERTRFVLFRFLNGQVCLQFKSVIVRTEMCHKTYQQTHNVQCLSGTHWNGRPTRGRSAVSDLTAVFSLGSDLFYYGCEEIGDTG